MLAALAASADEPGAPLQRVARVSVGNTNHELEVSFSEESPVPGWLDDLLTRIPDGDRSARLEDLGEEGLDFAKESAKPEETVQETVRTGAEAGDPFFPKLENIAPLYLSPKVDGEGIWTSEGLPSASDGRPLVYKTVYRPSLEFPNSIAYMAVFNMSRLKARLFIGEGEPGIYQITYNPDSESLSRIVAITNAMWMQQHARGAGAIFRGQEVYPMVEGMATMVMYRDESVDILEWTNDIPKSLVIDARQLRHLIVKNGKVVDKIVKRGKIQDAEIGLGGFLIDDSGRSTMANRKLWFLANRSAFGIRDDGNVVFAMGHHISTKDLARALALAGCKRAIHGDANIHNIVCNFYFRNEKNKIVQRERLSPEQKKYTVNRYDHGYSKDFFAFYER